MKTRWTRKGVAYIIDAVLAMVIVGVVFLIIFNVQNEDRETYVQKLQLARIGSDIVHVLSEDGTLDALASVTIKQRIQDLLPAQYNMRLKMQGTFPPGILVVETNTSATDEKFITSGKRIVAIENANNLYFAEAEYEVWQ